MKSLYISIFSLFIFSLFNSSYSLAQGPVHQMIDERLSRVQMTSSESPFELLDNQAKDNLIDPAILESYETLVLDNKKIARLVGEKNNLLITSLPITENQSLNLELILVDITSPEFRVYESSDVSKYVKYDEGIHYWGRVQGDDQSLVTLSMFDNEITGVINYSGQSLSLIKLQDRTEHILYNEGNLKDTPTFACFSDEVNAVYNPEKKSEAKLAPNPNNAVGMYIEVDNDIYQDFGSTSATSNYIMAVLNQVAILYANESINFEVDEMKIWNTSDPYAGPSTSNFLNQFLNNLNGSFNGDLAHLIGNSGNGGVAYVDVLCGNKTYAVGYSGIRNTFSNVPTYSWTVNVLTHEIGHNLGSPHTHSCSWNGNNTAIDGCGPAAGASEGCNGPVPSDGGTIMSYCHLLSVGINFNKGFGPQPGDLIRDRVYNGSCLTPSTNTCNDGIQNGNETGIDCGGSCVACPPTCSDGIQNGNETGVDCGGSCQPCPDVCEGQTEIKITIRFDNYPEETTWELRSDQGSLLSSGGPYGNQPDGSTLNLVGCLPDACYDFIIKDSYGDGICCGYGNGSYTITAGGETLGSGGQFGSSETASFCLGNISSPTCTDGVQNGDETGVDCGGSCSACATCTDGIQNGNETGVDCGGSCSACATCTDGIQNGGETGVDCGGSCSPCATCNDGVQNGDETGVDCGGSCSPCVTCNDGVQNGDETGVDCGGSCNPCVTCTDGVQNGDESGVDCGGSCGPCDDTCQGGDVVIKIKLDNYPEETSWRLLNAAGVEIGNGGTYGHVADQSTLNISGCLPVGCYTFIINDAYGDGICCSYGSGYYEILVDDFLVATGGAFGSNETAEFCVGDFPDTCTDGVQNGDETGIDCGGSCISCAGCNYNMLSASNFESGLGIWNDGGSDCRRSIEDINYAASGAYCVRLRDNTSTSVLTSDPLALASADAVLIEFSYIAISMDNANEDFWLQMSTNGGISYTTIEEWNYGDEFLNNSRKEEAIEITGPFTNNTKFRFRCDASSNADFIYLDDIVISSCGTVSLPADALAAKAEISTDEDNTVSDINLYPNPADVEVNVDYTLSQPSYLQFVIYDIGGRVIQSEEIDQLEGKQTYQINTSRFNNGIYTLVIKNADDITMKKFIVARY